MLSNRRSGAVLDMEHQYRIAHVGTGYTGSIAATAARVVNAIPAVCAANPGVLSALDLLVAAQAAPS
jgi:hypothetical protein